MTLAINLYFVIPQMPASIAQIVDSHMEAVILHDQTIAGQTKGDSEGETLSVLLSNPNKFQCILKASTFRHLKGHEDNPEQACYKIIDHYPKPRSLIFISPDESVLIHGDKIDCPDKRDAPIQQPQDKIDEDLGETIERIELEFIMSNGINYHMQADVNHEQAPTANLGQSEG